jgi:nesprin-1
MDQVSQKAQELLETNSDARISHSITQLTAKYQGLLTASKEIQKRLEGQCSAMRRYQDASDDMENWLNVNNKKLNELRDASGSKEEVENRLTRIRVSFQTLL